MFAYKKAASSL